MKIFSTEESKQDLRMILSCIIYVRAMKCENCQLCYQPVTIENYLLPTHTDNYALIIML